MYATFWVVFLFTLSLGIAQENDKKIVACYYASWANYRPGDGQFNISNIDTSLCTHLIYTFAGLDINSKIASLDSNLDIGQSFYWEFAGLKEKNPNLKTLLAIGGWKEGSLKYSIMTSTKESRIAFVESALRFVVYYGFDGIDIDWEYPAHRGGIPEDKENFVLLLQELQERLKTWDLMLTVAVPMNTKITELAYDIPKVRSIVDYVFLMAYDFTDSTSKTTGLLAPMSEIKNTVNKWIENASDAEKRKIVLGVPTYARTFNLKDQDIHGLNAATYGMGVAGEFTNEAGFLSYYELQDYLMSGMFEIEEEDTNYYAYSTEGTEWFTFDMQKSYESKADYVCKNNLGGMMIWTIDTDDFEGSRSDETFPVLRSVKEAMDKCNSRLRKP